MYVSVSCGLNLGQMQDRISAWHLLRFCWRTDYLWRDRQTESIEFRHFRGRDNGNQWDSTSQLQGTRGESSPVMGELSWVLLRTREKTHKRLLTTCLTQRVGCQVTVVSAESKLTLSCALWRSQILQISRRGRKSVSEGLLTLLSLNFLVFKSGIKSITSSRVHRIEKITWDKCIRLLQQWPTHIKKGYVSFKKETAVPRYSIKEIKGGSFQERQWQT